MNTRLVKILLLALAIAGCTGKPASEKKGTISISGAFALYPMAVKWADEYRKLHPDITIDVSAGGAGKGITDALSGMVDIGMVSRSVSQEEILKGAWFVAVTKDGVLPTVNSKNPELAMLLQKGLTKKQFLDIFVTAKISDWGTLTAGSSKEKINVYTRSDACGAAEMWAKYLGYKQEDLAGTGVFGDPGIADAIKKDANGIGFNNVIYVYDISSKKKYDGLEIVPIDLNEDGAIDATEKFYGSLDDIIKAIKENRYPSPPARDLFFVSNGKPKNELVTDFLKWILTDGQKFVTEGGYVQMPEEKIKEELSKLN